MVASLCCPPGMKQIEDLRHSQQGWALSFLYMVGHSPDVLLRIHGRSSE